MVENCFCNLEASALLWFYVQPNFRVCEKFFGPDIPKDLLNDWIYPFKTYVVKSFYTNFTYKMAMHAKIKRNIGQSRFFFLICKLSKGQLNSEWIYDVIVSPKMPTKMFKDFCPGSFLEGRAEILKIFGCHFGRTMTL